MGEVHFLRFLIDAERDPDLRAALRRSAGDLRSVTDLARFARQRGYAFDPRDVPVEAAQRSVPAGPAPAA
ncbi:hypothetical protein M2352_003665 [Azospirillum fermentarium]|uniref:Nif11-like leader peptide family natural product precursor n=1 Tax=Azospirillum fermentarium TaxID=1233114 RepID=UPI002226FEE7|nr:Nif11-like leader peptide family natural product precursor [Azospirillum fermentarium]MCW2248031.1 hypothetical protein [Azospirillum fermentarium]